MTTSAEYEAKIRTYLSDDLQRLWKLIQTGASDTEGWEAGKAFEYLVLRAFEIERVTVRYPYTVTNDEIGLQAQLDGAIHHQGMSYLVECKDHSTRKGIEPIAKLYYYLMQRSASALGIVFSRNGFTNPAVVLANFTAPKRVLLWDGSEIEYALENQMMARALTAKYRFMVEEGLALGKVQDLISSSDLEE